MTKGRNVGVRGALQEERLERAGREREKKEAGSQVNAVSQGGWDGC